MSTLTTAPLAPLLERLMAEADRQPGPPPIVAALAEAERARLMQSKTDYLEFYGRLKDYPLAISRESGALLYMLARGCKAASIVEFGTSFAISTLHLAAALRDNGGGRLITCEFEPSKAARARRHFAEAGVADLVELREGDAMVTLRDNLPETIDLVLLDGHKALYNDILDRLESRLRLGAFIVADNADWCPEYLARVRSATGGYMSVPFGEEVEVSLRTAPPDLRTGK